MKSKLGELDYMRAFACIAVIWTHISALGVVEYLPESLHRILITYINRNFNFTVPVFIFLSGLTGFYAYRKQPFSYSSFLKRRLSKTIIPYIIWSLIYYVTFIVAGYYTFDIRFLAKNILFGDMSYHFYFIIIILQFYILSPVFYYGLKKYKPGIFLPVVGIINFFLMGAVHFPYADRVFFKYMFFYALGIYAAMEYEAFRAWIKRYGFAGWMGGIFIGLVYTMTFYKGMSMTIYWYYLYCLSAVIFLCWAGIQLQGRVVLMDRIVDTISQHSYAIYLAHPLMIHILVFSMNRLSPGGISITLKLVILALVVPLAATLGAGFYTRIRQKIRASCKG